MGTIGSGRDYKGKLDFARRIPKKVASPYSVDVVEILWFGERVCESARELVRTGGPYPRITLGATVTLFCVLIQHPSVKLSQSVHDSQSPENARM